jgi:hypothetical protein
MGTWVALDAKMVQGYVVPQLLSEKNKFTEI